MEVLPGREPGSDWFSFVPIFFPGNVDANISRFSRMEASKLAGVRLTVVSRKEENVAFGKKEIPRNSSYCVNGYDTWLHSKFHRPKAELVVFADSIANKQNVATVQYLQKCLVVAVKSRDIAFTTMAHKICFFDSTEKTTILVQSKTYLSQSFLACLGQLWHLLVVGTPKAVHEMELVMYCAVLRKERERS